MGNQSSKELLTNVARLYYTGNMSQDEIAQILGLSRPKISRLLKTAREKQIVKFIISTPPSYYSNLAERLQEVFQLDRILVVPSDASSSLSMQNVARAGAEYLNSILTDRMVVGLAWGSTISSVMQQMQPMPLTGCSVWQLTACLPSNAIEMDGHEITKRLANKLNASWHIINAPFIVKNKLLRDLLLSEPEISNHFAMFDQMDVAIVGLGSSDPTASMTYKGNYITLEESQELVESGCAADLCGHRIFIDAHPAETFLTNRVISIDLETLRRIPDVVAIAAGKRKTTSIIAAARGKYINTLIIDEIAAVSVLNQLGVSAH